MADAPLDLGIFPLNMVALPGERIPLHIFEPRYRQLCADCTLENRPFVIVRTGVTGNEDIGCSCVFETVVRRFEDGRLHVIACGVEPVRLVEETEGRLYLSALVEPLADEQGTAPEDAREDLRARVRTLAAASGADVPELADDVPLSYAVAAVVELPGDTKQELLETRSEPARVAMVREILEAAERNADRARMAGERASTNGKMPHP